MPVIDYAERARAFVGTRFRPQGRCLEGLDCVGLICRTYEIPADAVRRNYRLRGNHQCELVSELRRYFRRVTRGSSQPGDVLLCAVGPEHFHLAVRTPAGFVHAHAGVGRVVETPGLPEWPILAAYRKRSQRGSC